MPWGTYDGACHRIVRVCVVLSALTSCGGDGSDTTQIEKETAICHI